MSTASQLALAQKYMTRYGMTTYVILGNIGLLFNIAIFRQPLQRRNSSSLYLLAASICALFGLNVSAIPIIYQLDYTSTAMNFLLYCQLQFYVRQALNLLLRIFFLFACADRYAMLSENHRIRSFSQYKVAVRIIPSVIVFFLLIGILPMMARVVENGKCDTKSGVDAIIYSMYVLIVVGILPLGSATVFSVLLYHNLKKIRRRIQPIANIYSMVNRILRKRDRDILRMLLVEILCYLITTVPMVITLIYNALTQTMVKNDERQRIESFASYTTSVFLLFATNSMSFWIYVCSSRSFRREVKSLIIKLYGFLKWKAVHANELN